MREKVSKTLSWQTVPEVKLIMAFFVRKLEALLTKCHWARVLARLNCTMSAPAKACMFLLEMGLGIFSLTAVDKYRVSVNM